MQQLHRRGLPIKQRTWNVYLSVLEALPKYTLMLLLKQLVSIQTFLRFLLIFSFLSQHLNILAKTVRDAGRLTALKPTRVKNEVDLKFSRNKGDVELMSNRFKTRIMKTAPHQARVAFRVHAL